MDALLLRGLEPPGDNPPAVQQVQGNFYGMSGPWGRGHAWASFVAGTPGAAVEEAHWAAALQACPSLSLCDSESGDSHQGPLLPCIAIGTQLGPVRRRSRQPYLLQRLLALHTPAPLPAAAAGTTGAAPGPVGPEAAYSYTWLAEEMLFVFVDAWGAVMGMEEWASWLDVNPALPFLGLLATLAKKLMVSEQAAGGPSSWSRRCS